jgi:polyisoprenyl-teichoic acid--peptidoglycan teichoic acid transferase
VKNERRRPVPPGGEAYTDETLVMDRRATATAGSTRRQIVPRRRLWPRVRLVLIGLLVLLLGGLGLFYWQVSRLAGEVTVADVRAAPAIATPLLGANVLVVGVDERPGYPGEGVRSDTLMLVRLDVAGQWVSLLSIPRDTQVELSDIGTTKINVAYGQGYARAEALYGPGATPQQGGMGLAAETVQSFLRLQERGMRVDYVAQVNFAGFAGVIDALGGVTIDVPRLIVDDAYPTENFGVQRVEFQPGPQLMDGERALIYARTRHADSDFGRAERQQQVVRAVLAEFQARSWPVRVALVPTLLGAVAGAEGPPPVLTTLPIDRPDVLFGLMSLAAGLDQESIGQFRISPDDVAVSVNGTNLIWNAADVQALLTRWARPPNEASEQARVQVFNGAGVAGLARQVSLELEGAGFTMLIPDNAPTSDYTRTQVYDVGGAPATSRRLARALNAELVRGAPPAGIVSEAEIVVVVGADWAGE